MAWTYILRCSDGSYYAGSTVDLGRRMEQHQAGAGSRYTASRTPVELVWALEFDRVVDAFVVEKQIQNWSRAKREALVEGRLEEPSSPGTGPIRASARATRLRSRQARPPMVEHLSPVVEQRAPASDVETPRTHHR